VRPELEFKYGPQRARATAVDAEVRLVRSDDPSPPPAGFEIVAEVDPLSTRQRATREGLLAGAGLGPDASDGDYLRAVLARPELRAGAARLRAVPDLPRLRLLLHVVERGNDR
jgi:hypothetical protein